MPPTLGRTPPITGVPVPRRRAGVEYWTPDDLGFNALVMGPDTFETSPLLFFGGLNSFMVFGIFISADIVTGQVELETLIRDPITETPLGARDRWVIFPPLAPFVTFGAFGTGIPFGLNISRGDVHWYHALRVYNIDVINPATVTIRLMGSLR